MTSFFRTTRLLPALATLLACMALMTFHSAARADPPPRRASSDGKAQVGWGIAFSVTGGVTILVGAGLAVGGSFQSVGSSGATRGSGQVTGGAVCMVVGSLLLIGGIAAVVSAPSSADASAQTHASMWRERDALEKNAPRVTSVPLLSGRF